jgi:biotin carboxyl carrier protein
MKEFNVSIDGIQNKIKAEIVDKKIWFKLNDQIFAYDIFELMQSENVKSKSLLKSADKICSPMPGKITKVFVNLGQKVKKGDALIVMEAMKMEYTLKSDMDSVVESIQVKLADQVSLGQLLIKLKVNEEVK